jgi:hypothetical protein
MNGRLPAPVFAYCPAGLLLNFERKDLLARLLVKFVRKYRDLGAQKSPMDLKPIDQQTLRGETLSRTGWKISTLKRPDCAGAFPR